MNDTIHYKYGVVSGAPIPFCELPSNYYPKKSTDSKNKLNPLPLDSSFGEGFCSDCNDKLKELKLIKE